MADYHEQMENVQVKKETNDPEELDHGHSSMHDNEKLEVLHPSNAGEDSQKEKLGGSSFLYLQKKKKPPTNYFVLYCIVVPSCPIKKI